MADLLDCFSVPATVTVQKIAQSIVPVDDSHIVDKGDRQEEPQKVMGVDIPRRIHEALKRTANEGGTSLRVVLNGRLQSFITKMRTSDQEKIAETVTRLTQCVTATEPMIETTVLLPVSMICELHDLAITGHVKYKDLIRAALFAGEKK